MEDIIKNDNKCCIGLNVRRIRLERKVKQTELVQMLQVLGVKINRETLVKIERGSQHIKISQLKGIKVSLKTTYEELFR